jgi:hypothetical protein
MRVNSATVSHRRGRRYAVAAANAAPSALVSLDSHFQMPVGLAPARGTRTTGPDPKRSAAGPAALSGRRSAAHGVLLSLPMPEAVAAAAFAAAAVVLCVELLALQRRCWWWWWWWWFRCCCCRRCRRLPLPRPPLRRRSRTAAESAAIRCAERPSLGPPSGVPRQCGKVAASLNMAEHSAQCGTRKAQGAPQARRR